MSKLQKSNKTSEKNGAKSLEKDGMGMDNQLRLSSKKNSLKKWNING